MMENVANVAGIIVLLSIAAAFLAGAALIVNGAWSEIRGREDE